MCIEKRQPWALAGKGDRETLGTGLYHAAETLRIVSGMLYPVMPGKMGLLLTDRHVFVGQFFGSQALRCDQCDALGLEQGHGGFDNEWIAVAMQGPVVLTFAAECDLINGTQVVVECADSN